MDYDDRGFAYDTNLEQTTLGTLFVKPEHLKQVLAQSKLRESSFYHERNRVVFRTILELWDKGVPATEDLVSSQLNGAVPKGYVLNLVNEASSGENIIHYADRLVELERWRSRGQAAFSALRAVKDRDLDGFSKARAVLDNDEVYTNSLKTPEILASDFRDYLEKGDTEAFALPYEKFNDRMAGGLRRKQLTILGGWTSHGKSVVIDQMLEHFSKNGIKCHLYINEMGREDRVARSIARETNVPFSALQRHQVSLDSKNKVYAALENGCPYFSITECAGWSIHELVYDIKSRDYDVIALDILHLLDYESEIELARISRLLNRVAKQNNCHVIATVHLNEYRVNDVVRPRPVTRDIRGSGMIKNDADNVMFIYREQDPDTGDPTASGYLYTAKVRNGLMGGVPLWFEGGNFAFREDRI